LCALKELLVREQVDVHKLSIGPKSSFFAFFAGGLILLLVSSKFDDLLVYQGATVMMFVIAISSIILLTGYSGQISLGHGAFLGVGGYAAAVTRNNLNWPIIVCIVVGVLAAAFAGALIGLSAARLSGPYLAGSTLALAVGLPSIVNQFDSLGGEQGLFFDVGAPPAFLGEGFSPYRWFFYAASLAMLVSMWVLRNLLNSRYGRSWRAVRGNDVAAQLSGINIARSRILAFTLSAGLAGLAGVVLAMTLGTVSPGVYPLALSFSLATGAVLSGVNTLGGVMIGAVTLVAIPEIADSISHRFGDSEVMTTNLPGILVSTLLILTVLFVPNGPVEQMRLARNKKRAHAQR
jgi:branched-chain amino acid transport system permease protein